MSDANTYFNLGDNVRLKTGGPKMFIAQIKAMKSYGSNNSKTHPEIAPYYTFICKWVDARGQPKEISVPYSALKKV